MNKEFHKQVKKRVECFTLCICLEYSCIFIESIECTTLLFRLFSTIKEVMQLCKCTKLSVSVLHSNLTEWCFNVSRPAWAELFLYVIIVVTTCLKIKTWQVKVWAEIIRLSVIHVFSSDEFIWTRRGTSEGLEKSEEDWLSVNRKHQLTETGSDVKAALICVDSWKSDWAEVKPNEEKRKVWKFSFT